MRGQVPASEMLGVNFEREIREQPDVWHSIANSDKAKTLAGAIRDRDVVLIGTGSSLFMAQLGALALRRRGINAHALSATESVLDNVAYRHAVVIACSQSGQSRDLLDALDIIEPKQLIALTNTADSPLAERANLAIDVGSGPEVAVPASKSVTATAAILLWAAGFMSGSHGRNADSLIETAEDVRAWLDSDGVEDVRDAARRIARRRSVIIASTGYGLPVAHEFALKLKEASYIHAEGFSAGEFRHGSAAMLDAGCAIIGICDDSSREIVNRPLVEATEAESLRYVVGARMGDIPLLGPVVKEPFNTLGWLVAGQVLALQLGRARYVESDAPRGLMKAMV
ncbi:MAG TPA: SIS domain-containing protein [Candidatus Baltobacteraceae bacterium]|jgi:glucosamine--fructose-6-phosphate aminotransferase (isomerizing)|nr:SIS domain-containing protein [Candidatus Baltobacteraceae bacterium]